jgi:acyl transferase domain-containing protein/thioesterase domain-containing protein/SAM-dependent methyltransferase
MRMTEGNGLRQIVFAMVAEGTLDTEAAMALIRRARALSAAPAAPAAAPAPAPAASRDIAVIGMAGRFGSAPDLDAYWRMLEAGEDCLVPMPERRWPDIAGPRRRGGFLPDEDMFDPLFFRISPNEAALMDPQQRLFLESAWHALEDAGYAEPALSGTRCGVFVGAGAGDYTQRLRAAGLDTSPLGLMGNVSSILAARISYLLNLKGPSIALDTACSSSLVAVHLACESLLAGTCDMALAGGVAVISTPDFLAAMTAAGMLSPHDRCASFGAGADGFVCGEGAGAVVLKRLADAERDGDAIIGVIRGSGINQDGRTNGITAPSAPSQAALEAEIYTRAGIDPATISYVEAHGTGTALGDPIEVEALTSAFRRHTDRTGFCALGSAKANIGHLLTAAGIAGLIKLLLMLRHRRIPPLAGFTEPNPRIDFAATPFTLPTAAQEWTAPGKLRAAVSSFGFSGTNAHVVVEEPPPLPARPPASAQPRLFLLSARSPEALRARAEALAAHLARGAVDARDLAFTLAAGREHFAHRLAVVANGGEALRARLQDWLAGRAHEDLLAGEARPGGAGPALAAFGARLLQEVGAAADAASLRALADLYTQGAGFDRARLPGCAGGRRIHLPLYPFERIRCAPPAAEPAAGVTNPLPPAPAADPFDGLAARLAALPDAAPDLDARVRAFQRVEAWGRRGLRLAYARLGLSGAERRVFTVAGLRRALGIVPAKERLHDALVDILVREEALSREGDVLRLRQTVDEAALPGELAAERARLAAEDAELAPFLALLARCLDCLPAVLTGALTPTEALFPDGRMDLVEPIYQGNRLAGHFNALIAAAAAHVARGGRPRLLEIGAGTGGATVGILAALEGRSFDYHYTDVSQGFVQFGRQRFAGPGMAFAALDITRDPAAQGFAPGSFDIVIASNVLHAAPRIGEALSHAASLLRPGGVLLLNEVTALQDFATLTFGLTDGWWAFEDAPARIAGAPLLDIPGWRRALAEAGFPRMEPFGLPGETDRERLGQSVIVALRGGAAAAAMPAAPVPAVQPASAPVAAAPAAGDLAGLVAGEVARALGLPVERLDRRARFMDFGIDSILGGQLIARLNEALGIDMRPTVVFDHPSVEDLARHIARAHAPRLPAAPPVAAVAPPAPAPVPAPVPATAAAPAGEDRRIAVIGMAARFADCPDLGSFREMLATGRSGITEVPADRWSADPSALPPDVAAEARFLRWGGFLRDAGMFDPLFFRISGREAELTDPQHRVFLTEAWRALEDAGYGERELDGRRCGVFVGAYGGDYTHRMTELGIAPEAFAFMGNAAAILAGRISYVLNLKGPNLAVDTACSSSLSALHLACRALLAGECDMALAGGVFLTTTMGFNTAAAKAGMLSPSGACHTFDAAADGFVPGEGAGVVILKPYAQALADGDHIEAVIVASAMNQDGKTNGITAPSPESQAALESEVYGIAGISPEAIGYVEAHGTGTQLGDPIEIEGLTRAFRRHTERTGFCAIGSVKTNIGHAAHAAGIAGFIKAVLSVRDGVLFPSINLSAENPQLRLAETPFRVNTALRKWEGPRLAAVSSFGFSGTNVHVLVAEPPAMPARTPPEGPQLVALSARNPAALARQITALAGWLATNEAPLVDIARTLNGGRCTFDARWAVVADSLPALAAALARGVDAPVDACASGAGPRHGALVAAAEAFRRGEDLPAIAVPAEGRRISLPTYPFEMRRYWLDAPPAVAQPAAPQAAPPQAATAERASLFAPDWQAAPAAPASMPGRVWLVAEDEGAGLAARWRAAGVAVTQLSPAQAAGAAALRRDGAPDAVVLLDLAAPGAPSADGGRMIAPLFHLLRALAADPVRVLAVHCGGADVSATLALRRSLAFGGASADFRTLELAAVPGVEELAAGIAAELAAPPGTGAAQLRGAARLARRMVPVVPARGFTLPAGGHFLITGGGGVLAALFARRLAAVTGGSVSLIGRGEPGAAARAVLADLGDRAAWFRADVTDPAALAASVSAARVRFGRVRGAIHAAGVPADLPLADSDWPRFAACLAPKMAGAVALDAALAADAPDFLVLFSSLAAELGDFGQGCYALGNAFCDRFAAWRAGARPGRTVSIGWPLWREGRGVLSPEGEKVYLATAGIPYLETEAGWQAFLDALATDATQVAVVPGAPGRAAALFAPPAAAAPPVSVKPTVTVPAAPAPAPELRPQVLARLTDIVAALLKIDRDLLDPSAGLADFGFDSIALKDFARLISETWGVSVSPAVFFARGTLAALAEYLVTEHGAALAVPVTPEPPAAPAPVATQVASSVEPVAIIGMAGQFPGSPDLDIFWRNLAGERELVGGLPAGRALAPAPERGVDAARLRAGFLERVDAFDAAFFRISPREACFLDPQHRLAIEAVWHAVEDAGIRMSALAGRPVGVFFGPQVNEYGAMVPDRGAARAQVALGNIATMLPNRISYLFDLRGPSEAIDTACSSSLVAVHRAVRALQAGECELALAGGVSLVLSEESIVSTAELGVVSPDGRCHSFDARANGYVKGEGVGVVLLKPLARALADGDPVQAVILGSAENHGGHAHSLTAPNGTAQAALIAAALRRAGVASDTVSYIEAHGTGTELGDPVEVMALKEAFAATAAPGAVAAPRCGLGTVKTNIGHLEPASGIAGLIKTVLALRHETLPASLNFERANPLIAFDGTPFEVVARTRPWARPRDSAGGELPRRAGVSSFGLGGSNAHVVLQEAPARAVVDVTEAPVLLTVSARDRGRLTALLERLRDFAAADPALRPGDVAHTLQAGREAMAERAAILLRPGQSLAEGFASALRAIAGAPGGEVWLGTARAQIGGEGPDATLPPLAQAAAAWAGGADLPAAALARGSRVRLPGYPFARTPFWFDQAPPRAAAPAAPPVAPQVAPPQPPPAAAPAPVAAPVVRADAAGLRAVIRRHLARALYLDEAQLDDHAGFADLGLDSILAVELAKSLNDELGTSLQATRLYDYANIAGLADWLASAPASVTADDPALLPVLAVLTAELAARGHAGLGGASRLDAIGLAPADGKAMLAAMNARFGTTLSEADVAACETLAALAAKFAAPAPAAAPVPGPSADPADLRGVIRRHLSRALYLDEAQLDDHAGFADLGLDSILAVELAKSLNDELGTALQATRLYDYANIEGLAAYLASAPASVTADDPALRPVLDVLTAELAARGHTGLTGASRLDAIGLAPADGKAMLAAMNARFGTALGEAEVAACETLAALAARFAAPAPVVAPMVAPVAAPVAAPVVEPMAAPVPATPDIAIIGYACRLPGAPDADAFWRLLEGDAPAITDLPPEPWRAGIYRAGLGDAAAWGGYIEGADRFDAAFFNIRPGQARLMDPLQRLFLETAWHALEAAGQTRARLDGAACGVFVGGGPSDYAKLLENDPAALDGGTLLGNTGSVMAARIAYFLNLRGPCLAIDTACSSGLVALHAAWQAIRNGECDMALVGGVNLLVTPQMHAMTGRAGMLAADGRCRSFDDAADGFVPAEGVVALVLKRLDRARADGDPVHALVRGVGVNQNGTTAGITAPSARAQARLLDALYRRTGIAPGEIGLVEAHGTGTKIGDALEFDALREAFAGVPPGAVALGSAKPLIGHAFAASGLASVVKLLLALAHRRIPPTRGLGRVNAHIRLAGSPFRINTAAEDWAAPPGGQRHAAATAYGLSGTNAHVVLAEPPAAPAPVRSRHATRLFVLSGTDAAALGRQVAALAAWLATARPEPDDLAYTLALRRTHFASRAAFAAASLAELRAQLAAWPAAAPVADPVLAGIGRRFCAGEAVDFAALYPSGQVCAAPGYAFAAERYWPGAPRDVPVAAPAAPAALEAGGGLDARLRAVIAAALEVPAERIAADLPFDALGLTSLNALDLIRRAEAEFGVALPAIAVWDNPTPARLATFIAAQEPAQPVLGAATVTGGVHDPLVTIRASGARVPSFWVHGGPGDVNWVMELARRLPADMPVYAFEARGLGSGAPPPDSVEAMAAAYVARLVAARPEGPIVLGGYSAGGAIAFEMARQLEQAGRPVARLLLLDANAPGNDAVAAMQEGFGPGYVHLVAGNWLGARWGAGRPLRLDELDGLDGPAALEAVLAYLFAEARPDVEEATARRWLEVLDRVGWSIGAALRAYRPSPLTRPVETVLVACTRGMAGGANPLGLPDLPAARAYRDGWEALLPSPPRIVARDCDHFALLRGADAAWLGETLAALPEPGAGPADVERARVTALVVELVRRMLPDVPPGAVVPERSMSELGATSMDRVEVATLAMEALGIVVPNRELAGAGTIGGLIDILCRHGVHA